MISYPEPMHWHQSATAGEADRRSPAFLSGLLLAAGVMILGYSAFTAYEAFALALPFLPYETARFTPYYLARSAFALAASGMLVWSIAKGRSKGSTLDRLNLRPASHIASLAIMLAALAITCVFLVSPATFERLAAEDSAIEWASAILVLLGSGLFAAEFLRRLRHRKSGDRSSGLGMVIAGSIAVLLFLIGMEEISWMQRLLEFETPAAMAEANWQDEFNLHNFQTYLAETVYYSGAVLLLILLPLLAEAAPGWPLLRPISDFLPGRFVVAASAPVSIFNYGHWNIIPIQITAMTTLFVLLAYARAAGRRQSRPECALFLFLAAAVAAGQAAYLIYGPTLGYVTNTTEFKEFFIAVGLACYALDVAGRSRRRAGAATGGASSGADPEPAPALR